MSLCPKCGATFPGQSIGSHAAKCGVTVEDHFWSKVERRSENECWPWQGRRDKSGYGRLARKGPDVYAHRIAYRLAYGPVPDGMDVLHTCDNRWCCNARHYFLGTQTDNNADCYRKGRTTWGERSAKAKLTEAQVLEIYPLKGKISSYELGRKYGVNYGAIAAIWRGDSWSYLRLAERFGDNQ